MDTVALDKAGISPLQKDLDKINAIQNTADLLNEAADLKTKVLTVFLAIMWRRMIRTVK